MKFFVTSPTKQTIKKQAKSFALKITAILVLAMTVPSVQAVGLGEVLSQKNSSQKFLPVHEAFKVSAVQDNDKLVLNFVITPNHYAYRDKIKVTTGDGLSLSEWQFNKTATSEEDPEFGKVWVFDQDVTATAKITAIKTDTPIKIRWQGCARAGLCYPPETISLTLKPVATQQADKPSEQTLSKQNEPNQKDKGKDALNQKNDTLTADNLSKSAITPTQIAQDTKNLQIQSENNATSQNVPKNDTLADNSTTDSQNVTNNVISDNIVTTDNSANSTHNYPLNHTLTAEHHASDPFGLANNPLLAVGLLFLAGLVLAFSACVYPMIPIVTNIVARQHNPTPFKGFALTLAYGVGVATSYGLLGAAVAFFGRSLGVIGWMQNAWVLLAFALIFVGLALYMLEIVHIRLPSAITSRLQAGSTAADGKLGSVGGSFLVGLLSALVVSPCVSAPLGGALVAVATLGNVALGFFALFALGLGLSFPLIVMGAVQGKLMLKSGSWMNGVRHFGGFLLFAVAILLINRVFVSAWVLLVWAVWLAVFAVWLWRSKVLILQGIAMLMLVWSGLVVAGASLGAIDAWQPLSPLTQKNSEQNQKDIIITNLNDLDKLLSTHDKVLVDVTADWCIECHIMDKTLFKNRPSELNGFQVVRLDISETTDESRAILSRYELFGPPALLYYHKGQIVLKQIGEIKRDEFVSSLKSVS